MSKEEYMKIQKYTLKVHMHCKGCKQEVKRILQKIDGVFIVEIDLEQGKGTVSGIVGPEVLINKLAKSKKHAELWAASIEENNNSGNNISNQLANQMKNMQIVNVAGGNNNRGQNRNCETGNNQHKGGVGYDIGANQQGQNLQQLQQLQLQQFQQQMQHLQQHQQMKDQDLKPTPQSNDAKMPPINQNSNMKTVKFNVPKDDSDFADDELDDVDDQDFDDESDDEMVDLGHPMNNMKMPPVGNGNQMMMSGLMNPQMMNGQMLNQQMMNAQKDGISGSLSNMMNLQMMDAKKRINNGYGMRGGHHSQMINAEKGVNNGGHTAGNGRKSCGDGRADGRGGGVIHVQGNDENKGGVICGNSGRANVGPMGDNRSIQMGGLMSNMSLPMNQMGNLPTIQCLPTVAFLGGGGSGVGGGYFPITGGGSRGGYFPGGGGGNDDSSGGGYFQGGSGDCASYGGRCFQGGGRARGGHFQGGCGGRDGYFQGGGGGAAAAIAGGDYFHGAGPQMIVGNPYQQQQHVVAMMEQQ